MERNYNHLSEEDRVQIFHWHSIGESARAIGVRLGRHHSTISRELERNARATKQWDGGYEPLRAHGLALRRRRWDCRFKLARQPELRALVREGLAMEHSPEQIAGRLAHLHRSTGQGPRISHEAIYRYIYHRVANKDFSWHVLLPRRKYHCGRRPKKGGPPSKTFENYVSIESRPAEIAARSRFGDWEGDLMAFRHNREVLLVAHERRSRITFAWIQPNKGAEAVRQSLTSHFLSLPPRLRRSITYDNGTEYAQHHLVTQTTGIQSYFCHTHSPWEKGGVENAIGRLRRNLPRRTSPAALGHAQIQAIIHSHNNRPRKCLGYLTPNEVWTKCLQDLTVALQP